jgi:hypothetical protein
MNKAGEPEVAIGERDQAGTHATLEDHERAFTEVSFFLEAFAATVGDVMGGATASVGRSAGRCTARKLPVYLPAPTLESVLEAVAGRLRKGFEIEAERGDGSADGSAAGSRAGAGDDSGARIRFGRCAIREVCRTRGTPVGGELCRIFHYYLDGVICELACCPTRSHLEPGEEACRVRLETK